jgi:hypothetical protein
MLCSVGLYLFTVILEPWQQHEFSKGVFYVLPQHFSERRKVPVLRFWDKKGVGKLGNVCKKIYVILDKLNKKVGDYFSVWKTPPVRTSMYSWKTCPTLCSHAIITNVTNGTSYPYMVWSFHEEKQVHFGHINWTDKVQCLAMHRAQIVHKVSCMLHIFSSNDWPIYAVHSIK